MISKLKAQRAVHRRAVTKLLKRVDPKNNESQQSVEELRSIMELIKNKQKLLSYLNSQILDNTEEAEMEEDVDEADRYDLDIYAGITKIQTLISQSTNKSTLNPRAQEFTSSNNVYQANSNSLNMNVEQSNSNQLNMSTSMSSSIYHKLPKLNLPTFEGNILDWPSFWDSFTSAVHDNPSLSDIQKFNYLKSQLYGEANHCIAGLQITSTNYDQATTILLERFGQEYKIVNAYMQNLLNLPAPSPGIKGLKSFSDSLESYIRGLESLGQCQESYGSLLIPLILNKLPSFVRHNITRDHGNDDWDISTLRKALKKEICIQEAAQSNPTDTEVIPTASFLTKTTNKRWKSVGFKEAKDSSKPVNKRSCLFCQESHHSNDCTKVTDQHARHRIVKEKRVCSNCFGNHKVSDCMSKYKCRYCGKKHHSSICNDRSQNKSVVLNTENQVSDDESKANDNENTSVMHSSVSAHTEILLKTAIAPVWYNDQSMTTNILLDEGAQNSFITHELAEKLQIQPSGKVTMQISAFGGNEGEVRNLDKATISIETESKVRIPMSVIIVPKIAAPIHMKEYAQVTNLPYLKGLKLAHPVSNDDKFNISLLIGADYYWSIVQDEIIRGKGPTAVKSKIGYLLSGPIYTSVNTTCTKQWNSTMMNVLVGHKTEELNLQKFWEIESCGTEDSDENEKSVKFMSDYQNSCINFEDGRYIAKLPWKTDHPKLTTNESVARRRTQNVVNRLNKDPEMLQHYSKIIKEQEMKGFIEKVPTDEIESKGKTHYIPHHPVIKVPKALTGKDCCSFGSNIINIT